MTNQYFNALANKNRVSPHDLFFELRKSSSSTKRYSFSEINNINNSAATMFQDKGIRHGDIVLIFAQHSIGMLAAFFGAQMLGAIPSFMPPPSPKQDFTVWQINHAALIERTKPKLLIAEPACLAAVSRLCELQVITTTDIESLPDRLGEITPQANIDDIAFLQHSSGTTGLKKGVMVTYRQLLEQIKIYGTALSLNENEATIVSWLPIYHDMGLIAATLMPFTLGIPVRSIDTMSWLANPNSFIEILSDTNHAYAWMPDFAFRYLAKLRKLTVGPTALAGVKAIVNCSEPCKADSINLFKDTFAAVGLPPTAVRVCYAMAEYVFAVTQTDPQNFVSALNVDRDRYECELRAEPADSSSDRQVKRILSVGKPLPGTEIRIEAGVPDGQVGEIHIKGLSLCNGYFRNPTLTKSKFIDGWYRTGDIGFIHDGELYVSGRLDDMIIVRGRNLYAHDMEEMILGITGVKPGRSVVFGIENFDLGSQDIVIAAEIEGDINKKEIESKIRDVITSCFGVSPIDIVLLPPNTMIKTTSGKISRSENARRYQDGSLGRDKGVQHAEQ